MTISPLELFIDAFAVSIDLLLPLVRKSLESGLFPREHKKGKLVKILRKMETALSAAIKGYLRAFCRSKDNC